MRKLKTLKDIEVCGCCSTEDMEQYGCIKPELKQEAIKWVKEIEKNGLNINGLLVPPEAKTNKDWNKFMVEWIKHFFNITEEDLK